MRGQSSTILYILGSVIRDPNFEPSILDMMSVPYPDIGKFFISFS